MMAGPARVMSPSRASNYSYEVAVLTGLKTECRQCREVVHEGENGLLVPVRDAQALSEALSSLIKNPELRAQMGRRSRAIALKEFSLEKVIDQTLSLYKELAR